MTTPLTHRLLLSAIYCHVTLLSHMTTVAMGYTLSLGGGMEDNCILSFVVPRDKMKSSCNLDEKVQRRLNTAEMKVNLYSQQVASLQQQLDKQRNMDMERIEKLEQQMKSSTSSMDMNLLVERRLALLEKEFEMLHHDMNAAQGGETTFNGRQKPQNDNQRQKEFDLQRQNDHDPQSHDDPQSYADPQSYGDPQSYDAQSYDDPQRQNDPRAYPNDPRQNDPRQNGNRNSRHSADTYNEINAKVGVDPHDLSGIVRSLVRAEVTYVMDNFTQKFERYVRDQILLYNSVFKLMPERSGEPVSQDQDQMLSGSGRNGNPQHGNTYYDDRSRYGPQQQNPQQQNQQQNGYYGYQPQGDKSLSEEIQHVRDKLTYTGERIARRVGSYIKNMTSTRVPTIQEPRPLIDPAIKGIFSNDSDLLLNEDLSDTNFSYSGEHAGTQQEPMDTPYTRGTGYNSGASSRISQPVYSRDPVTGEEVWEDNMIRDQRDPQGKMDLMLRDEITSLLYTPLAEVMSLMTKHTSSIEQRIRDHEDTTSKVQDGITEHLRGFDQSVQTIEMQVESLSQGFQDASRILNTLKPLESKMADVMKMVNASSSRHMINTPGEGLIEQDKKFKKLERLMGVYHQSLEHYRNESKFEYRKVREIINQGASDTRHNDDLKASLMSTIMSSLMNFNTSFMGEIARLTDQIRQYDDSLLIMNLDINTFDRQLKSKTSRSERQMDEMEQDIKSLTNRQRDFRKRFDQVDQVQMTLGSTVNTTAQDVFNLMTELKLRVLDEWLPMSFEYDSSRTECFGKQYVKRSQYKAATVVGVVLCSPTRYKIFLATSLHSTFLNVGDGNGMGEDHCEFVGANVNNHVTLSPFKPSYGAVQGFARNHWGQDPIPSFLNTIKPTPHWYECGVAVP